MDREVLKLMAHLDQTRADVRVTLEGMDPDNLIELFRDCMASRLAGMDEPEQQLVGMLAALAIYDLCQSQDEGTAPGPACPRCEEDDIDRLVWIDDEKVRCDSCGTVYDPNLPET